MHNKKGLTIIECLLSIIILAVMLTAGMAFYFNAQASMRGSIHKRIAVEMASAELEKIKNMSYASLPNTNSSLVIWPEESSTVNIGNLIGQRNVYVKGDTGIGFKQIRVSVSWQDAGKSSDSIVSLDTYIAP